MCQVSIHTKFQLPITSILCSCDMEPFLQKNMSCLSFSEIAQAWQYLNVVFIVC